MYSRTTVTWMVSLVFASSALKINDYSFGPDDTLRMSKAPTFQQWQKHLCNDIKGRPTFQQWRHCNWAPTSSPQALLEVARKYPTDIVNFQFDEQLASQCALQRGTVLNPSEDQLTMDKADTDLTALLESFAPKVEAFYILCVDCKQIKLQAETYKKHNVFLVSGVVTDGCLKESDRTFHWKRVTFSHKTAVAHARHHKFISFAMLEEDVIINQFWGSNQKLHNLHELLEQVDNEWAKNDRQLIRFASMPWHLDKILDTYVDAASGTCPREECKCYKSSANLCRLNKGCDAVHDSSFYMMKQPAYESFLHASGVVDMQALSVEDSVLVLPPLTWQTHFGCDKPDENGKAADAFCVTNDQIREYNVFENRCVRDS